MILEVEKKGTLIFLLFTIVLSCRNNNRTELTISAEKGLDSSVTIEQLYNLASTRDEKVLALTDSILHTTSDQNSKSEAYYIKGLYYANTKQTERAIQYFDSTIIENYTFTDAYIERAIALNEIQEYSNAVASLKIALQLTKNNADLYYWLGRSYEGLARKKEANNYYEIALSLDPEFTEAKEAYNRTK